MPDRLFDLLSKCNYDDLSDREKKLVHDYFTREEYNDLYEIINNISLADKQVQISMVEDPPVQSPTFLHRLINYRIPLYKVAGMFLVVLGAITFYLTQYGNDASLVDGKEVEAKKEISLKEGVYPEDLIFEL